MAMEDDKAKLKCSNGKVDNSTIPSNYNIIYFCNIFVEEESGFFDNIKLNCILVAHFSRYLVEFSLQKDSDTA